MKLYIKMVVVVLVLICAGGITALGGYALTPFEFQGANTNVPLLVHEKDPFIAGLLSWLMMGVGQIYCKEYTKGSIFMAFDLADKLALVSIVSYINRKYSPAGGETVYINWKAFDKGTRFLILGYLTAKYSIKFYNVYDAVQSAKRYNALHLKSKSNRRFTFQVTPEKLQLDCRF